jgi:hypothetical protein
VGKHDANILGRINKMLRLDEKRPTADVIERITYRLTETHIAASTKPDLQKRAGPDEQ